MFKWKLWSFFMFDDLGKKTFKKFKNYFHFNVCSCYMLSLLCSCSCYSRSPTRTRKTHVLALMAVIKRNRAHRGSYSSSSSTPLRRRYPVIHHAAWPQTVVMHQTTISLISNSADRATSKKKAKWTEIRTKVIAVSDRTLCWWSAEWYLAQVKWNANKEHSHN